MDNKIKEIVENIVLDITDRRGLKDEWYAINEDIQEEIKQSWYDIIEKGLED